MDELSGVEPAPADPTPEGRVDIRETRTVRIELPDRPLLTTPAGRSPIGCKWVQISWDLLTGQLSWVSACGALVDERDLDRQEREGTRRGTRGRSIERSVMDRDSWRDPRPAAHAPSWLLDLIDEYGPTRARSGCV